MKHNFTAMKKDYETIPIPQELESRLKQSIAQAKSDLPTVLRQHASI